MLRAPNAIAFDLDGTLVDSRLDIAAACNHTLRWAGRQPLEVETIATYVGDGARKLLARAFGIDPASPELDAIYVEFERYYAAHCVESTRWMPHALAAISALGARLPLAIVTNKMRSVTERIVNALGARDRFAAIYAGGDGPLKPSPEPMLALARELSVAPQDIWVVGDGVQDVASGDAAGCTTIAVLGGFASEQALRAAHPDALIPSLADLPALVDKRKGEQGGGETGSS
jgi:phosphoglycolate phosphatase